MHKHFGLAVDYIKEWDPPIGSEAQVHYFHFMDDQVGSED